MDSYFVLFQDCVLTDGYKRSIICDLGQKVYVPISKDIRSLFIKDRYFKCDPQIGSIATQLKKLGLGYLTENLSEITLTPRRYEFYTPKEFSNVVLDVDNKLKYNFINLIEKVAAKNIGALQMRFAEPNSHYLMQSLSILNDSPLRSIEIYYPYLGHNFDNLVDDLISASRRITFVVFWGGDEEKSFVKNNVRIIETRQDIFSSNEQCGWVNESYFISDIEFYSESRNFNNCLNKKIAVDVNGSIKNCPYSNNTFGHIDELDLSTLLDNEEFLKLWSIKKDDIKVCQDCEFRYICSDCRYYTENGDLFGKPIRCTYNPYKAEWEG